MLLPESGPSGDEAYQPVIPFRVQVKGTTILGLGACRAEKALPFADGSWTAKLEPKPFFFLTPLDHLMANHTDIVTVFIQLQGVVVRLTDTGKGIPSEIFARLFEKVRPDYHPKMIRGTGMGLYLCKLLIELHKGKITASSF